MLQLTRCCDRSVILAASKLFNGYASCSTVPSPKESNTNVEDDKFRVLQLKPPSKSSTSGRPDRNREFKWVRVTTQRPETEEPDWPSVWPAARTFHPDVVKLPLRQGYVKKHAVAPGAYGNAELLKIPNFLHLTPPAIKQHCQAIKRFCTKWPEGLETEEKCNKHFPLEIITSDYCFSAADIREPLARIVTLRVKLSSLNLNAHAKDKLLRLVGDRYNQETDVLTITADRCPLRKQNLDYVYYLLTALYHESWREQVWEAEKSLVDMEEYDWEKNRSKTNLMALLSWPKESEKIDYTNQPFVSEYKTAVSDLINNGEDEYAINKYKDAVKTVLKLQN